MISKIAVQVRVKQQISALTKVALKVSIEERAKIEVTTCKQAAQQSWCTR